MFKKNVPLKYSVLFSDTIKPPFYYYFIIEDSVFCSLGRAVRRHLPLILLACRFLKVIFSSGVGNSNSKLEERDSVLN